MKMPRVQREIIDSIMIEVQRNEHWSEKVFLNLAMENPIVAEYLMRVERELGSEFLAAGLILYRLIESQMEANELKELFKE